MQMAVIFAKYINNSQVGDDTLQFIVEGDWEDHRLILQKEGVYTYVPFRRGYVYDPSEEVVGEIMSDGKVKWLDKDESFDVIDRVFPDIFYHPDRIPVD